MISRRKHTNVPECKGAWEQKAVNQEYINGPQDCASTLSYSSTAIAYESSGQQDIL
jgi:hypothetical protein